MLSFSSKDPGETITCSFNFAPWLGVGETVSSATVSCSIQYGVDPGTSSMLQGAASLTAAPIVMQKVTAGLDGCSYLLTATANTSAGNVLVIKALLPVSSMYP
jgi:hypothetical protein